MSFLELAGRRRSIRQYTGEPVPDQLLEQVLEAGRLAPTACNLQPIRIHVVLNPDRRCRLCGAYARDWIGTAPVLLVICAEPAKAWCRRQDQANHAAIDAAIVADHLTLAACDLGLGTCWICAFDPDLVRAALDLPAGLDPVVMLPLGYPAEEPAARPRKGLDQLVVRC